MSVSIHPVPSQPLQFRVGMGGHELPLEMPPPAGPGPDPHDYFDAALGGCKALTLMLYARSKSIPLESIDVLVERDASDERRGVYRLKATLTLNGALADAQVEELLSVADRCPIHKLMTKTDVQISTTVARGAAAG